MAKGDAFTVLVEAAHLEEFTSTIVSCEGRVVGAEPAERGMVRVEISLPSYDPDVSDFVSPFIQQRNKVH